MCRLPVTLGGGITMVYGSLSELSSARKKPLSIQKSYHPDSIFDRVVGLINLHV